MPIVVRAANSTTRKRDFETRRISRKRQVISLHRPDLLPSPPSLISDHYRRLWDNFFRAAKHLLLNVTLLIADRTCVCVCVCARVYVYDEKKFVNPRNWYFQQLVIIRYKSGVYHYMPYPRRRSKFFLQTQHKHIPQHPTGDRTLNLLSKIETVLVVSFFNFYTCVYDFSKFWFPFAHHYYLRLWR